MKMAATLIKKTLKGNVIIPFTSDEYAAIWGGLRMNKSGKRKKWSGKINAKNLLQVFEESKFKADPKKRSIERRIPRMVDKIQGLPIKDNVKRYKSLILNKTFDINRGVFEDIALLKNHLRDIAREEYEERQKVRDNLLDFFGLLQSEDGWRPDEAAKRTIREAYRWEPEYNEFLNNEVNQLLEIFGFDQNSDKVFSADDADLAKYGFNADKDFLKDNPIVVVHGARAFEGGDTNALSFSIYNVITHGLEQKSNGNNQHKNLGQNFIYEGDLDYTGINLYNTVSDVNKVFQGLALISANNRKPLKIRNMGTVSLQSKRKRNGEKARLCI